MSNTSSVTPYAGPSFDAAQSAGIAADVVASGVGIMAACTIGAFKGVLSVAQWLSEETTAERQLREFVRVPRCQGMTGQHAAGGLVSSSNCGQMPINSVPLTVRKAESLLQSAESLGYKLESGSLTSPKGAPAESMILLSNAAGERLALERNARGRLVLHTAGDKTRIQGLVRKHTVDRAVDHLKSKGMQVQALVLPNGELQLRAHENTPASTQAGQAQITANVRPDGSALIDIDKVKGSRCQEIVKGLADAIGGQVVQTRKKDAFYQLPGESTKTRIGA